ncbi:hypothetical protein Tco_1574457, partial [Tanacetum coccineum]
SETVFQSSKKEIDIVQLGIVNQAKLKFLLSLLVDLKELWRSSAPFLFLLVREFSSSRGSYSLRVEVNLKFIFSLMKEIHFWLYLLIDGLPSFSFLVRTGLFYLLPFS